MNCLVHQEGLAQVWGGSGSGSGTRPRLVVARHVWWGTLQNFLPTPYSGNRLVEGWGRGGDGECVSFRLCLVFFSYLCCYY